MKMSDCQIGRHKWNGYKCEVCGEAAARYEIPAAAFSLEKLIEQMGHDFGKWSFVMSRGTYDQFRRLVFEKSGDSLAAGGPADFLGCTVSVADDIITGHGKAIYYMVPVVDKK
jgi:hypothetical protein